MIYTALGVKINIFRSFPVSLRMASGFFYFRIFPKDFSVFALPIAAGCVIKKENKYSLLLRIYVCFLGGRVYGKNVFML